MSKLFAVGWRGMLLRNEGPPNKEERFLGIENEGKFTFSKNAKAGEQLNRGLSSAKTLMQNKKLLSRVQELLRTSKK